MGTTHYKLIHNRYGTYVLATTAEGQQAIHDYALVSIKRYGRELVTYMDAITKELLFPNCLFDSAGFFEHGFAPVVRNGRYFHINLQGKVAYRWRFLDVGHVDQDGITQVQHPRAFGWSRFSVRDGAFITNPPRYTH